MHGKQIGWVRNTYPTFIRVYACCLTDVVESVIPSRHNAFCVSWNVLILWVCRGVLIAVVVRRVIVIPPVMYM